LYVNDNANVAEIFGITHRRQKFFQNFCVEMREDSASRA